MNGFNQLPFQNQIWRVKWPKPWKTDSIWLLLGLTQMDVTENLFAMTVSAITDC